MKMLRGYLRSDVLRFFQNPSWIISIAGVAVTLWIASRSPSQWGIIDRYIFGTQMTGGILVYVFCAGAFSRSVCEDFENREFRYYLARGNKLRYITSRSIVIFFGAVVCMIAGTILFVLACRISMPWVDTDGGDFYSGSAYFELIRQGHYLLYFILYALHMGLVAGTLSVVSAFTSLFIRNKVMVLAMPTLLYRLLLDFSIAGKDLYMLFPLYKCITNDALNFLFVFALTASTAAIFTVGMYFRIDKWL